jgi:hypothetical protein
VVGGVCCVLSVFGVLLSSGVAVELPAAAPLESVVLEGDEGMLSGVDVGADWGSVVGGVCVLSGTVAPGVIGAGLVLLPPEGVCSLIGWLLCDGDEVSVDGVLDGDCATTNPADRIASVAMYVSFFISEISLPWNSIEVAALIRQCSSVMGL